VLRLRRRREARGGGEVCRPCHGEGGCVLVADLVGGSDASHRPIPSNAVETQMRRTPSGTQNLSRYLRRPRVIKWPHLSRWMPPAQPLQITFWYARPWLPRVRAPIVTYLWARTTSTKTKETDHSCLPTALPLSLSLSSTQVCELRRQEGMDPPIPANVLGALDAAEGDLRLLRFKYAALAAASAKRPRPPPAETSQGSGGGGDGGGDGGAGATGEGGEMEEGISEEDLRGLLEEHVRNIISSRSACEPGNMTVTPTPVCPRQVVARSQLCSRSTGREPTHTRRQA